VAPKSEVLGIARARLETPPSAFRSRLERLLSEGTFACTAEINPPKGADPEPLFKKGEALRGCADAFNVTDNPTAKVHLSALASAHLLRQSGLEPVLQVTTRDRNRLALQADLLGASALGIHNILALGGDPLSVGNDPTAKPVFDVDATGLLKMAKRLRDDGVDAGGGELRPAPHLFLGGTLNPFGGSVEVALKLFEDKLAAGADFFQTQAVFDVAAFESFWEEARSRGLVDRSKVLVGIIPLKSAKIARHLATKVPGIVISQAVLDGIERASDPEAFGKQLASELITELRTLPGIAGVHVMAIAWEEAVRPILNDAGLLPRPSFD
jgi:methylenetetrahydrofolate reductase (NADH)